MKIEDVDALNQAKMEAFYKSQFANAADFTFLFVGCLRRRQACAATRHLHRLAAVARQADVNLQHRAPAVSDRVKKEVVNKGQEPKAQTVMSFFADTGLDELEMHRLRAATAILERHLRDQLREELGGTYSVGVDYSNTLPQPGYGMTSIQFGSSPDRADTLVATVMTELDKMRRDGPSADDVQKVKETEKEGLETSIQAEWLLAGRASDGADARMGSGQHHPSDGADGYADGREHPRRVPQVFPSRSLHAHDAPAREDLVIAVGGFSDSHGRSRSGHAGDHSARHAVIIVASTERSFPRCPCNTSTR